MVGFGPGGQNSGRGSGVSIFDRLKPKSSAPNDGAEIKVEFTADEQEAINRTRKRYASVAHADAPEGTKLYVHPRVMDALVAQGLNEYVEDLMRDIDECPVTTVATVIEKAIDAQRKAYTIHNLPVYLFQLAGIFEFAGDAVKAREYFQDFLRAQGEFKPDRADAVFFQQMGFDLPKMVTAAKEKVAQTEPNLIAKADLLGESLVSCATETANIIIERLGKDDAIRFRDEHGAPQFIIEVIAFYMHMVDRLAFTHLGAAGRKVFGDRLIVAIVKEVLRNLNQEVSADEFGKTLRATYNRRQKEYARYKVLIPEKDKPLKDTLYWEVSKVLFGLLDDENPATLMFLSILVADMAKIVLYDTLKVEDVLQG